jgi:sterol desaturase/sphingolipid hydroxylase (fatty acid hydroxylase superfamily)
MQIIIFFILGVITWPFMEYMLHRFLGHTLKIKTQFKTQHTRHHVETDYFAPNFLKIAAAIPVCIVLFVSLYFLTGTISYSVAFTSGFILMYAFYEWTHWTFHTSGPTTRIGKKLRKHHLIHHFHNPKMNHGVTSTIFDLIFKTYIDIPVVKVPKQVSLPWLFEKGSEQIKPAYQEDYQLR